MIVRYACNSNLSLLEEVTRKLFDIEHLDSSKIIVHVTQYESDVC